MKDSRVYTRFYIEKTMYVWLLTNFSGSAFFNTAMVLLGISGDVSDLIFLFHSLIVDEDALMICG